MASKEQYAKWIVDNQDKKGTPEFDTVAAAYKSVMGGEASGRAQELMQPPAYNPTTDMSGTQKFLAGAGKGMTDLVRGAGQMIGVVSDEDIAASRQRDAPLMNTGAGMAGNIAGNVAATIPAMLVPGAATVRGAAAIGAGIGALAPVSEDESRLGNAGIGAAGGAAGGAVAKGLSRVLNPQTGASVKQMIAEGVTPTPGQTLGGAFRRTEEAAKSIPFVGEGIRKAEARGIQDFNRAALNRVLSPIGKKSTAIGNEGVEQARNFVSSSYDDALKSLKRVDIDTPFSNQLARISGMTQTLPDDIQRQFNNIMTTQVTDKLTPAGTMSAEQFKTVTSEIGKLAQGYKGATNSFDQNQLGDALFAVRKSLMDLAGRMNPSAKEAIGKADKAYAQLLRVENAASKAQDGIFMPSQLATAARQMDKSSRKVSSAQGKALMQDFSQQGRDVLSNTLPNSGTADRAIIGGLALGGGYLVDPTLAAAALVTRGAYTSPAQKAISSLLTKRPELARSLGGMAQGLIAPAGAAGGAMTQGGR